MSLLSREKSLLKKFLSDPCQTSCEECRMEIGLHSFHPSFRKMAIATELFVSRQIFVYIQNLHSQNIETFSQDFLSDLCLMCEIGGK